MRRIDVREIHSDPKRQVTLHTDGWTLLLYPDERELLVLTYPDGLEYVSDAVFDARLSSLLVELGRGLLAAGSGTSGVG